MAKKNFAVYDDYDGSMKWYDTIDEIFNLPDFKEFESSTHIIFKRSPGNSYMITKSRVIEDVEDYTMFAAQDFYEKYGDDVFENEMVSDLLWDFLKIERINWENPSEDFDENEYYY